MLRRVLFRLPDESEHALDIDDDTHILDAALAAGLDLPYSCLRGWCLTCAAVSSQATSISTIRADTFRRIARKDLRCCAPESPDQTVCWKRMHATRCGARAIGTTCRIRAVIGASKRADQ